MLVGVLKAIRVAARVAFLVPAWGIRAQILGQIGMSFDAAEVGVGPERVVVRHQRSPHRM
ncbi:hypothetical protein ASU32_08140 [Tsukamurella tyrosinosolvens]|nr:hypothetical protein ASU32_08140 [Tsukamurella tyrosinosolvens]